MSPMGVQKTLRLQKIALEQKLPIVTLTESGGANLNYAAEVFTYGGMTFANQARMSAAGFHKFRWYMVMPQQVEHINLVFLTM
jgi:geranyl-CoA carboxylase beta subunit